jgi:regulator of sigma E protease
LDVLLTYFLPFFGILMGLIVLHEAGHYVTAKLFGVRVLEAGIGLPPRVWGFRWRDTDYTINAIPLGAFVRMLGEEDPEAQEEGGATLAPGEMNPESLAAQPKWKRTIIIGAGAFMNFVVAVILFTISLMIPHPESISGAQIAMVAPGSPAEQAGLRPGDQILAINGRKTDSTNETSYLIQLGRGTTIDFTVERRDPATGATEVIEKAVYARWDPPNYTDECGVQRSQGPTGIQIDAVSKAPYSYTAADMATIEKDARQAAGDYNSKVASGSPAWCYGGQEFGFSGLSAAACADLPAEQQAAAYALKDQVFQNAPDPCYVFDPPTPYEVVTETRWEAPWNAIPQGLRLSFESLVLTRNQLWMLARGFNGSSPLTGPVGIAQVTGQVVKEAGWLPLVTLAASISMSLALFNALPIPMVDGGRLFFILIEFLRGGRRIAPQKEALVHFIGFVALILFAVVVTYFDIIRIIGGDSLIR